MGWSGKAVFHCPHQLGTFQSIGIPRFIKQHPEQRNANLPMDDTKHQDVNMTSAKLPVGAVQSQMPRFVLQSP